MYNSLTIVEGPKAIAPRPWADMAGLLASLGCAIHCAAMPFVIGYLPSLGLSWLAGHGFHQWMSGICAVAATMAFLPGWRRHRQFEPLMLGAVGICLLTSAAFLLEPCCDACVSADCSHGSLAVGAGVTSPETVTSPQAAHTSTAQSWTGRLGPYATPLGGLVLIAAHLLNHRFGCRCCAGEQSCQTSATEMSHEG